jgi:Flp pilus assembly protein protease CpaA
MNPLIYPLELLRFLPLCAIMGYAAYLDYKTGEVPNKIWLYTIFGGTLTLIETLALFSWSLVIITLFSIGISGALGLSTFFIGGGGADAKALITLGFSAPLFPLWGFWPLPFTIFVLFAGSALALPFMLLKKSKDSVWKRKIRFLPYLFIGLIVCVIL